METIIIAAILAVAGIGLNIWGGAQESDSKRKQIEDLEREARLQQQEFESAKADVYRRGAAIAGQQRSAASRLVAAQSAAYAASGVDVASATAVSFMAGQYLDAETNVNIAMNNAYREALGYEKMQAKLRREVAYAKHAGEAEQLAISINTAAGSLSGASSATSLLGQVKFQNKPNDPSEAKGIFTGR